MQIYADRDGVSLFRGGVYRCPYTYAHIETMLCMRIRINFKQYRFLCACIYKYIDICRYKYIFFSTTPTHNVLWGRTALHTEFYPRTLPILMHSNMRTAKCLSPQWAGQPCMPHTLRQTLAL